MESLVLQLNGNLTQDTVESFWMEGQNMTGDISCRTCAEVLCGENDKAVIPGKGRQSLQFLSRDGLLLSAGEEKDRWVRHEYRRVDSGGMIHWVSCVINLYKEAENEDLHIALWVSRLDLRHRWETEFGISIYKDSVSKLYTRSTVRELSTCILERKEHKLCALVLVEIGGMARVYAQYSEDMEMKWKGVILSLLLAVGTDCIPGQFASDRYLLFFPEIAGEDVLKRKLEQAFLFVRSVTSDLVDGSLLRFMAGGVCRYQDETNYNIMMKKVQTLCQSWENSSGDRVVFASDNIDERWDYQLKKKTEADQIRVSNEDVSRPLSDREKDAAFRCILGMLNAESLGESSQCVLRTLGEYYEADRTYILVTVENGRVLTMPHEWTAGDKRSIQQAVSGMYLSRLPVVEQCARENKPVFLTRKTVPKDREDIVKTRLWRYAVFPMRENGRVQAYLCIENPHNHISDATLSSLLGSCLLKERKKYLKDTGAVQDGRQGADLPNYHSFMEAVYNYNSDVYSTLGMVCIDVPEFSAINSSQGFEYGRKLLWYITKNMADIFGRAMLYRTWDAEFVAICPNTTRETFRGKCARLRSILTRRYPRGIRVGYAWSDKVFTGKALLDEAKLLMQCEKTEQRQRQTKDLPVALSSYGSVSEMVADGRFTVFFQPEIDMETGTVVGAEALVRGTEDSGGVILPVKFIGAMEKNGDILELDLFVLDYVMRKLEQWKTAGRRLVPVAVNFSRSTLLYPRLLASVLAIQSRYPEVDPGLVVLEIAENAADVGQETLTGIMETLRGCGLTFCLDNFGARYSNVTVLANVPLETVKVDRSLISDIADNENNLGLIKSIVNMCRDKKTRCLAEGVETKEQKELLLSAGCRLAQGFYFDRPLAETFFEEKYLKD